MKYPSFLIALLCISTISMAQLPKIASGTIERIADFKSSYITSRNVDVWLPEGFTVKKKYPVLYMHDGQMLFDSGTTWNHTAWDVDDVLGQLIQEKKIREVIVVGIWNGGITRHSDYFPQKPFEAISQAAKDTIIAEQAKNGGNAKVPFKPVSDGYLQFIVKELKPFIDKKYPTLSDRPNTFIAGSSMGGLISMYAICEYPQVFGGAACFSTHWPGILTQLPNPIPNAFFDYLKSNLPSPATHLLYFDYGDQTLDALYPPLQQKVDKIMQQKGFTEKNWMTKFFAGENHSEIAWKKRLHIPIEFLLKP